jgi:transglutaminase/protease-like cytokinesis protein 3
MKTIISILLWSSICVNLFGQIDFERIDNFVKSNDFPRKDLTKLTLKLTENYNSDVEKLRAIYTWIANNIEYDLKQAKKENIKTVEYWTEEERVMKWEKIRKEEIKRTLRKKRGVCEDYSNLLKEMCHIIGIESNVIVGYGRTGKSEIGRKPGRTDHAWNSVKINNEWYLMDLTWASGYVDSKAKKYHKDFRKEYFLIRPKDFVKRHYPEDSRFQYLDTELTKEAFSEIPLISFGYYKYGLNDYYPKKSQVDRKDKISYKLCFDIEVNVNSIEAYTEKGDIAIKVKKENNCLVVELGEKKRRYKYLTFAIRESEESYSNLLTYKVK